MELTHASFFSGVGGLDLGLERAGWRTVSFSEIDPYASAVLAERWPGVPNLGDITAIAASSAAGEQWMGSRDNGPYAGLDWQPVGIPSATLWSGGFPCQDLSVAGKRAGFAGERSSLAFAFLDLVERHRPPAILLENVPGLLSSNGGRDFGALLRAMGELGYGWAYRVLDARHFGVPQRRRRVFIVGLHAGTGLGADSAAEVLSVGTRCDRHPATGLQARSSVAADIELGPMSTGLGHHGGAWGWRDVAAGYITSGPSPDPGGVRAADGLARRLDDSVGVVQSLDTKRGGVDDNEAQAGHLVWGATTHGSSGTTEVVERPDQELLPLGLDSHRYRCCGNGVVSSVSEWVGLRLAEALA